MALPGPAGKRVASMSESAKQWYCLVGGVRYGPVADETFREWIRLGRVGPADMVWADGMPGWQPLSSVQHTLGVGLGPPRPSPAPRVHRPHRGGTVLALGIVGLVVCWPCGAFAWSMGNADLRDIRAGRMDPTGEGMTQGGRICGMIATILGLIGCCGSIAWFLLVGGMAGLGSR